MTPTRTFTLLPVLRPRLILLAVAGSIFISAANAQDGDPYRGATLFATCSNCHEANSTKEKVGPGLKGLFNRPKLVNGQKPSEQAVRRIIDTGGNKMPSFAKLPKRQKDDLIAFLMTL